ncbi:universal stress protein [Sphaerisporangium siamense]|uniref:Nucleotide-binding universal stress UspA family protein n=1 Tax=Sphaerisporangium siamense TaxID=795645 RepID=A0A7W7G9W1_9ACTN|nr:universal stress protein [Sphaerisporangium siamense]MBB4703268.1 nucleotide-binding universal stress UspA family protein [Sphaerisporangium siamense]GII88046.1 universal stress protein [Sphaerisporangium siamense]
MTGRIVVGIDGSPSAAAAVEWAADEAARAGAALKIVHVREPWSYQFHVRAGTPAPDSLTVYWRRVLAAAAQWVHAHRPSVPVTCALVVGAAAERLTTESEEADELILGSKGLGGLPGMVLGSVGRSVAGRAEGPVIIVRRAGPARHGAVVAGFDGSASSQAALDFALAQARARGARARVVYAWHTPPFTPYGTVYAGAAHEALAEESTRIRRLLGPWQDRYPDVAMTGTAVRGHPVPALADASRDADLVVVGSPPPGPPGTAFAGSVGQGVLRRARCPVAIVHPRGTAV